MIYSHQVYQVTSKVTCNPCEQRKFLKERHFIFLKITIFTTTTIYYMIIIVLQILINLLFFVVSPAWCTFHIYVLFLNRVHRNYDDNILKYETYVVFVVDL